MLTQGRAEFWAENPLAGLAAAYARGESDEFVKATAILPPDGKPVKMEDGDSVIFLNFRSDRARQLSRARRHHCAQRYRSIAAFELKSNLGMACLAA
ncbi:MAG: hypothetical protein M1449_12885 [Candidatus Thermoplasmatota archaeon]|nr:hypothetical protein [Candidatus Thermoplasmatota archaeon]